MIIIDAIKSVFVKPIILDYTVDLDKQSEEEQPIQEQSEEEQSEEEDFLPSIPQDTIGLTLWLHKAVEQSKEVMIKCAMDFLKTGKHPVMIENCSREDKDFFVSYPRFMYVKVNQSDLVKNKESILELLEINKSLRTDFQAYVDLSYIKCEMVMGYIPNTDENQKAFKQLCENKKKKSSVNSPTNVYVYLRRLTEKQSHPSYVSHICRIQKVNVVKTYCETASGREELPVLELMIDALPKGSLVYVHSVENFSRSKHFAKIYLKRLHEKECVLYSVQEGIYSSDKRWTRLIEHAETKWQNRSDGMKEAHKRRREAVKEAENTKAHLQNIMANIDKLRHIRLTLDKTPEFVAFWDSIAAIPVC